MKCQACKQEIMYPETELHKEPQRDRKGNIKSGKKDILYHNYHKKCWELKKHEEQTKQAFNQYLIDKFFVLQVPQTMWQYLMGFRHGGDKFNREKKQYQGYPFEVMHGALLLVEDDLVRFYQKLQNENQFTDDIHKINLILKYMCKNLDTVYGEYKLKQKQQTIKKTRQEITNTATENKNFVVPKSKNKFTLNELIT